MRIWSLHPKYLDTKGLVALWRETLLAKKVLEGNTEGYKNHPQLLRFKITASPLQFINQYLSVVYQESLTRGYHFNVKKIDIDFHAQTLTVTQGQIEYKMQHLLKKLKSRDLERYNKLRYQKIIEPHPIFRIIDGEIEEWEVV